MKLIHPKLFMGLFVFATVASCKKEATKTNQPPVANAGASQTITLPINSATLHGNGTDADGKIVTYFWSQTSGPAATTIVNPGAASTDVTGFGEGHYIFQLTVTDDQGAIGTNTVSVIVNPSLIDTLVLQPDQNPNEVTIAGNNNGLEACNPVWTEDVATAWTKDGALFLVRNAFGFDLSSIPANATIQSAKLSLFSSPNPQNGDLIHANFGADNSMLIQRITTAWQSASVTWANQPSSTNEDQVIIPSTQSSFLDLTDIDVTQMITKMTGANQNYGFLIRLQTEQTYTSRIFCSSRYSDPTKHPKLVVVYKIN